MPKFFPSKKKTKPKKRAGRRHNDKDYQRHLEQQAKGLNHNPEDVTNDYSVSISEYS